jgi:TPP-dependent pyruvate/acetoin dehydrogenase alpha subunit
VGERDPIARVERFLDRADYRPAFFDEVSSDAEDLARRFRAEVQAMPDVPMRQVFDTTFHNMPDELVQQRAEHEALEPQHEIVVTGSPAERT